MNLEDHHGIKLTQTKRKHERKRGLSGGSLFGDTSRDTAAEVLGCIGMQKWTSSR
jgi:hypothetical protein